MYVKIGGAARWLNLPLVGGQPSELTKLALVLFLARNLSRKSSDIHSFTRGVLPNILVFGVIAGLLLVQRDLGTPVLLFTVTFFMLFAAGVTRKFILTAVAAFAGGIGIAVIFEPYRMARVMSFLDPWSQVKGSGFQIIQSFVAFQNGGLLGVGLGESKQKLFFLPEAHTDFILAVIGEELGLLGVLMVCAAFGYLGYLGFKIAHAQKTAHRRFLAFGITVTITVQACINIGVCMGLLPTKGMTLPFVSSGNSSLLVFLVISAILTKLAGASETAAEANVENAGSRD
jgi:cell division protein FtsW